MRNLVSVLAAVALVSGCPEPVGGPSADAGSDSEQQGNEGHPCYPNQTCNDDLVCLSDLCVRLPDAGQPDSALPDVALPDTHAPDVSLPDTQVSDANLPDAVSPDVGAPDTSSPADGGLGDTASMDDAAQPDGWSGDTSAPDAVMVDSAMADTAAPDAPAADTAAPDTAAPDSAAADAAAPDAAPFCGDGTVNGDDDCEGADEIACSSVDPKYAPSANATCDACSWDTSDCREIAVLKWANGGCGPVTCQTGWYSSPAVADLDGTGGIEVIGALYTVYGLNGETGETLWSHALGGRAWSGVIVADLDDDTDLEVAVAARTVTLVDHSGVLIDTLEPWGGDGEEIRGLIAADLDNDGPLELIASEAGYDDVNLTVVSIAGVVATGWPQVTTSSAQSHGIFNANPAVGDIDGDLLGELIVPSDVNYIAAYQHDGSDIAADAVFGASKVWGNVPVWQDASLDEQGWGSCDDGSPERFRPTFAHGPAVISDVDANGTKEIVVTGNVYDCFPHPGESQYIGLYIFNADRTRWSSIDYDWYTVPLNTGAPLSEDYDLIENAMPNPAVADLDNDGEKEIIFSSYDGRVHAFWLDQTEHGSWPYSVYDPGEGFFRFASEPVVVDLDNDGNAILERWARRADAGQHRCRHRSRGHRDHGEIGHHRLRSAGHSKRARAVGDRARQLPAHRRVARRARQRYRGCSSWTTTMWSPAICRPTCS